MGLQIVGVVGAGVMGKGVAQTLAHTGHRVILIDVSDAALEKAREDIVQNIRLQALFKKKESLQDADRTKANDI